ncbi:MAG: CYTH domain-containing protein [Erysipelotrichaceae bacterium]|nr:CYTH domain-containing protein [Erysipelotrichaceae bacterium]
MEKNIETEYKLLIDESTFNRLNSAFNKQHCYEQTNYYLTSPELAEVFYSFRMRQKGDYYEMTLKTPTRGIGRVEMNCPLTEDEFNTVLNGTMISNEITKLLKDEGFDLSQISQEASLKTIRHDIQLTYGMLSLDENYYLDQHDYELEFEMSDLVNGPQEFKQLLDTYGLTYTGNGPSKIKRVLDALKL